MNCPNCQYGIDLHQHDAEVRKPLVKAAKAVVDCFEEDGLLKIEPIRDGRGTTTYAIGTEPQIAAIKRLREALDAALAQTKELP